MRLCEPDRMSFEKKGLLQQGLALCSRGSQSMLSKTGWHAATRGVAQLAEHRFPKPGVAGSIPSAPVSRFDDSTFIEKAWQLYLEIQHPIARSLANCLLGKFTREVRGESFAS